MQATDGSAAGASAERVCDHDGTPHGGWSSCRTAHRSPYHASATPQDLSGGHNRRAVLRWPDRQCADRQHHTVHPAHGDSRVQPAHGRAGPQCALHPSPALHPLYPLSLLHPLLLLPLHTCGLQLWHWPDVRCLVSAISHQRQWKFSALTMRSRRSCAAPMRTMLWLQQ